MTGHAVLITIGCSQCGVKTPAKEYFERPEFAPGQRYCLTPGCLASEPEMRRTCFEKLGHIYPRE